MPVSLATRSMGGRLAIHVDAGERPAEAAARARLVAGRIDAWAARLTRHSDDSDLARLNAESRLSPNRVRPTLAAALLAGREACRLGNGYVDITMLDARLAAESGTRRLRPNERAWRIAPGRRGSAVVTRPAGLHFDLGGVGKGWIADRALRLLAGFPGGLVDADGDMAIRSAPGRVWEIGIDDPRVARRPARRAEDGFGIPGRRPRRPGASRRRARPSTAGTWREAFATTSSTLGPANPRTRTSCRRP